MTSTASLTIRHATAADEADLTRLAALDSSRVPSGELLVAQLDGNLVAALSIDTGAAIADPFEHTAAIVDSMRAQVRETPRPAPRGPARPPRAARCSGGRSAVVRVRLACCAAQTASSREGRPDAGDGIPGARSSCTARARFATSRATGRRGGRIDVDYLRRSGPPLRHSATCYERRATCLKAAPRGNRRRPDHALFSSVMQFAPRSTPSARRRYPCRTRSRVSA